MLFDGSHIIMDSNAKIVRDKLCDCRWTSLVLIFYSLFSWIAFSNSVIQVFPLTWRIFFCSWKCSLMLGGQLVLCNYFLTYYCPWIYFMILSSFSFFSSFFFFLYCFSSLYLPAPHRYIGNGPFDGLLTYYSSLSPFLLQTGTDGHTIFFQIITKLEALSHLLSHCRTAGMQDETLVSIKFNSLHHCRGEPNYYIT